MEKNILPCRHLWTCGQRIPVYSLNTLIIGSGAAALNAAVRLHAFGVREIAVATACWGGGTSANAGSDKQTYYKISLAGDLADSTCQMAADLSAGGSMHGDIALIEALNSARSFYHLVELGVPFPHDRYGAYVGYKTDHDPRQRATSAGPLTSRLMVEALQAEVRRRKIPVFDRHEVISLLTNGRGRKKRVVGAAAIDTKKTRSSKAALVLFNAVNIVLGTGGPAGIYKTAVYPESQVGSHGLAFAAGAIGQNLTESQYGLASIKFRWNLSGSYQQVIPRYFSVDPENGEEHEFLTDFFPDMSRLATAVFLKGYQWPFDPEKVLNYGSSLIDILVYRETVLKGRKVFLDFRRNPSGGGKLADFSFDLLSPEARAYLENSGALLPTPIARLARMNPPAIAIYRDHGIDLTREPLEIAVCAQHNNGGFKGNIWWESNIRHLFPVGEANGSHGVRRPGGSALNAGQVGSLRAAQFISRRYADRPEKIKNFVRLVRPQVDDLIGRMRRFLEGEDRDTQICHRIRAEIQERMSACGAIVRRPAEVEAAVRAAWKLWRRIESILKVRSAEDLPEAFRCLDLCLTQAMYLEAIQEYLRKGGKSRGSYLVPDPRGQEPCPGLGREWRFSLNKKTAFVEQKILEVRLNENDQVEKRWVPVRPIPQTSGWFESVWEDYREDRIVREEE